MTRERESRGSKKNEKWIKSIASLHPTILLYLRIVVTFTQHKQHDVNNLVGVSFTKSLSVNK